jgi:hypothetical protein
LRRGTIPANGNTARAFASSLGANPVDVLVGLDGALYARAAP